MRAGDLAPDHPDVGAPDLTLSPVDESDLLAQVEAVPVLASDPDTQSITRIHSLCGLSVVNTVDLDQTVVTMSETCNFPNSRCSDRYLVLGLTARLERW